MSLIFSIISGGMGSSSVVTAPAFPMIVFSGESNSGGYALNSDAMTAELATRPETIILNNNSLLFESLQIGVNNYIKHAGMSYPLATDIHGWELGLSNIAAAGTLGTTPLRLVKTGQGGSVIAQWAVGASFNGVLIPWDSFQQRVDAALANTTVGAIPFALFYSQGINDAIAGTDITVWQNATIAHFAKIRAKYGQNIPIIMTKFMSTVVNYTVFNAAVASICSTVLKCYFVDTEDLARRDNNHWSYAGMKILSARMLDKLNANI